MPAAVPAVPNRLIEENLWRAIRHGLDGRLIDLDAGRRFRRRGGRAPAGVDRRRRAELSLDEHLGDLGMLLANGNGPSASAAGRMRAS